MKKFMKSFALLAVAALGLSACNDDKLVPDNGNADGKFVTVHFGAEAAIEGATKATLTPNEAETMFASAWEKDKDVICIDYYNLEMEDHLKTTGAWNGTAFVATLPTHTGMWEYQACYPNPNSTHGEVSFGSERKQNGNLYNSDYDIMISSKINVDNGAAGKDDKGKDIVFNMERQTGIAYFHLTGGPADEKVVSATLSVEDGFIASQHAYISDFAFAPTENLKEITITYKEGTAPMASNFQLWFNVLPTMYTKMTLTVETANHTLTISRNAPEIDEYLAGKLYKVVKNTADKWVNKGGETPVVETWIATDLADITATDEVVITMAKGESVYAMTSDNGEKNPSAVAVAVKDGELSATPADNLVWNIANDNGNLTIYPNGQKDKWLCAVSGETDVKVGNSNTTKIFTLDATTKYLKNTEAKRYLGVSVNKADWRAYASTTSIDGQTLCFYVKGTPKTALKTPANLDVSAAKVVSWDAVSGAASYEITIGTKVFTSETNSYDATAVVDDYYDVAVVAIPTDKENYKNSAAATLTDAKFGTPKLPTPDISAGVLEETSVAFSWTKDARATNGYHWALYNGETLVQEATETSNTSTEVTGLTLGTTYTAKVYALAVDGEKPYVQSATATLDLKTKAKTTISTIVAAGTGETKYSIADLTVMAVSGKYFVVKDDTGIMTAYKSTNATANVGDIATLQGTYGTTNGLNLFTYTSYSKGEGSGVVDHGTPYTLNADNITDYTSNSYLTYVKATVSVGSDGSSLTIGSTPVYLRPSSGVSVSEFAGRTITLMGYAFGYDTGYNNVVILGTSVELDQTAPYLSVDPTSKTWESDETTATVFTVTTNTAGVNGWTVTPETLTWATVEVDKDNGTITVTPNGANNEETANEETLTVRHSAGTLTETISLTQKAASSGGATPTEQTVFLETFGSTTSTPGFSTYTGYSATAEMFTTSGNVNTHYSGSGKIGKSDYASANLSSGYTDASGLSGCFHAGTKNTEATCCSRKSRHGRVGNE